MSITITENVAEHVRSHIENNQAVGLRLGVKPSGCSGFGYTVEYAEAVEEDDAVFDQHGVQVVVARRHLPFLEGMEVDYVRDGINRRYDFRNPNVRDLCGCGESFTV